MSEIILNFYPINLGRMQKLRKKVRKIKAECQEYPTYNSFPKNLNEYVKNIKRTKKIIEENFGFLLKEIAEYGDDNPTNVVSRVVCVQEYLSSQVFIRLLASLSLTNRLEKACQAMELDLAMADRLQECIVACVMENA